jgi:hypothetical protein
MPPTVKLIGAANLILPPHIVATQLKMCMADAGTAARVPTIKTVFSVKLMPVANMWCAHEANPTMASNTNAVTPEE